MGVFDRVRQIFAAKKLPEGYPTVTARVSVDEERQFGGQMDKFLRGLTTIAAKFPFEFYGVIDNLTLIDPYVSKYHQTTISLGNLGHSLEIDAPSEAKADAAINIANDLAARCYPLSGGMDGLVNSLLSQVARAGGLCVEWVPDKSLTRIERAFVLPIKTLRWRYNASGELELVQIHNDKLMPLNMVQTSYHNATMRDTNPYPIPPALAALESCAAHRTIIEKIRDWMEKVSALGVLLASVSPPPREIGESQSAYDLKAQTYLERIASSLQENMTSGIGVGYNNIEFQFANTQSSAQGAKDILQIVLQGLFAALQRDPVFFGWNFNSTETFAKVVFEEMQQGIKAFQLGIKRVIEHGHRLNFALTGMGAIGVSVVFNQARSIDVFRDAEAEYMQGQNMVKQIEAGIITVEEARKLLGHDDKKAGSGEFVASFSKSDHRYVRIKSDHVWQGADLSEDSYEEQLNREIDKAQESSKKALLLWLLLFVNRSNLPPKDQFIRDGLDRFISSAEESIDLDRIGSLARSAIKNSWLKGKNSIVASSTLFPEEEKTINFLVSGIEQKVAGTYLSRSTQRQSQIESFLSEIYADMRSGSALDDVTIRVNQFADRIADNTSDVIARTSVARASAWAQLHAMQSEGIEMYMVEGPRDGRKCAFCWGMLGRRFSVATDIGRIYDAMERDQAELAGDLKFLKDKIELEDLGNMGDAEIQETGMSSPPYHPRCRDYLVPVKD